MGLYLLESDLTELQVNPGKSDVKFDRFLYFELYPLNYVTIIMICKVGSNIFFINAEVLT